MAKLILTALLTLSLLSLSSPIPSETFTNAAETLSNSGYIAMSLTLNLVSQSLLSQPKSATIFTPPDTAFAKSGQPSLSLLQLHFSPLAFSVDSLRSLSYGIKIPTLSTGNFLTVTTTTSTDQISLNNVKIIGSPIFDDGLLIVFAIENFFDLKFAFSAPVQSPSFDSGCGISENSGHSFHDASGLLISRGYSVMASFLNLQLLGFLGQPKLTVFAPVDEVMVDYSGRFPDYPSLFLRHVLPCTISWRDLVNLDDGTVLGTSLEGFSINITNIDDTLMVNEVPITFPDMYYSDWLVIHGVREILALPNPEEGDGEGEGESSDYIPSNEPIAPDSSEL